MHEGRISSADLNLRMEQMAMPCPRENEYVTDGPSVGLVV
jgi:hypothetical protein